MIRVVDGKSDAPGPLDEQARAMLERILAHKPFAIGIIYESAASSDFMTLPPGDMMERGIADWIGDNFPRKPDDE